MNRVFKLGDTLMHFKREFVKDKSSKEYLYMYLGEANHTETGETLVIYQALYGDKKVYARPKDMFMSKVDKSKYPDIRQLYRLEKYKESNPQFFKSMTQDGRILIPFDIRNIIFERKQLPFQPVFQVDVLEGTKQVLLTIDEEE